MVYAQISTYGRQRKENSEKVIMHLYIEEIDLEHLKEFTEQIDKATKDEPINIYVASIGWWTEVAEQYVNIINAIENPCKLFATHIHSCALRMYMNITKERSFASSAYSICHAPAYSVRMMNKNQPRWDDDKFLYSDIVNEPLSYLTKEENERYMNGDDVYLNRERLREIFWF